MFKYAKGASNRTGREFHPYHEIVYFMGENAYLYSDILQTPIKPDTVIVIPKETYHQLNIIGDPESYLRCVLNFGDIPELEALIGKSMNRLYILSEVKSGISFLFEKLIKTAEDNCSDGEKAVILKSVLSLILSELEGGKISENSSLLNPFIQKSIKYIEDNIAENFRVRDIARFLNVSESLVSHIFKKEMNVPIHRYILEKRLTIACQKILSGTPATVAAYECGFNDYSNFYRQYKKNFGFPPSSKQYIF